MEKHGGRVASLRAWLLVLGFFTLSWIVLSIAFPRIMPGPLESLAFLYNNLATATRDALITVTNTLLGFIIALGASLALSLAWLRGGLAALVVERINIVVQSVSALVWAIVFLLIFGYTSRLSSIGVAAATAFPILLSGLTKSLETTKAEYGELASLLGKSRSWELKEVYLPASVPALVASSRSAIGAALRISVVAEAFGGAGGIGYRMWMFYELHKYEGFLAWSLVLIVLMLVLDRLALKWAEEWSRRWMA